MSDATLRMAILQQIDDGALSAAEGARLLAALAGRTSLPAAAAAPTLETGPGQDSAPPADSAPGADSAPPADSAPGADPGPLPDSAPLPDPGPPPEALRWRRFWLIPFFLGAAVLVAGAWLMALGLRTPISPFWLLCGLLPFWGGTLALALAFASRKAPWIHVRVHTGQNEWPRNIAISLPAPLRLTAWVLRHFGGRIPQLAHTGLDEVLLALDEGRALYGRPGGSPLPLYIEVDEGDGERVQVYFG